MGRRADRGGVGTVGQRPLEQPESELLRQDAPVGVVDAGQGDPARAHLAAQQAQELPVVVRDHHHVDARVDGGGDLGAGKAGLPVELVDRRPVGHDEPGEAQLPLEDVGDEVLVGVRPYAVPAAVGEHHRAHAALDGLPERRQVDRAQLRLGEPGVALVDAAGGAAVAEVVLGGGEHGRRVAAEGVALQAGDERGHGGGQFGRLTEGLVRTPPTVVAGHAQAGREGPVDAGTGDLLGDRAPDTPHQGGVPGGAQADVVREERGAAHRVVAVHRVDAVDHRDAQRGGQGRALEGVVGVGPGLRVVGADRGVAAGEHRADAVGGEVGARDQGVLLDLGHLAELVVERHPAQQVLDTLGHRQGRVLVRQRGGGPRDLPLGRGGGGEPGDGERGGTQGGDERGPTGDGAGGAADSGFGDERGHGGAFPDAGRRGGGGAGRWGGACCGAARAAHVTAVRPSTAGDTDLRPAHGTRYAPQVVTHCRASRDATAGGTLRGPPSRRRAEPGAGRCAAGQATEQGVPFRVKPAGSAKAPL